MTVLVGAKCVDGVVIGADGMSTSAAGMSPLIQMRSDDKVRIVGDRVIVAGTGSVGLGQRFHEVIELAWRSNIFSSGTCMESARKIAGQAVQDFVSTGTPNTPGRGYGFAALMAAPISDRAELVEFGLLDMQPEVKTSKLHFVTMGSGQILADPFMAFISRVLWKGAEPSVQIAKFGVYWALNHAIEYAPGGVGKPIQMAVLQRRSGKWKASVIDEIELGELAEHISEIERRVGAYPDESIAGAKSSDVPLPQA